MMTTRTNPTTRARFFTALVCTAVLTLWGMQQSADAQTTPDSSPAAASSQNAATTTDFDWRGVTWNTPRKEVEEKFADDDRFVRLPSRKPQRLTYLTVENGQRVSVVFVFTKRDRLIQISVFLATELQHPNEYVAVYDAWVEKLQSRYGKGRSTAHWKNNRYSENKAARGPAVAGGHLTLDHVWKTGDAKIATALDRVDTGLLVAKHYLHPDQ